MLYDLINLEKLRRACVYTLMLVVLLLLQNVLLANLAPLGVRAVFVPVSVVCVGLFEGGVWGAMYGLAAGYFMDMGQSETTILFMLVLGVCGYFTGLLCRYELRRGLVTALVLSLGVLVICALCQMLPFLIFTDTSPWAVVRTGLLQVLWSLPFTFLIYYPCRYIAGHDMMGGA